MFSLKIKSNRQKVLDALYDAKQDGLDACGSQAAGYAFMLAPHDTGRLRNSITWATKETEGRMYEYSDDSGLNRYSENVGTGIDADSVYIGTNVEYAVYQEMGTSKTDPQPYLRPALERHLSEYKEILKHFLENA